MNSWECELPSPEMYLLLQQAKRARLRVDFVKEKLAASSPVARPFWRNVLNDRDAELRAIEDLIMRHKHGGRSVSTTSVPHLDGVRP